MRRPLLIATALLAVLACAYTWPLLLHPASRVAHDRGDPLLVTWILWWSTHTLPLTTAWWNAPAFYPSTGVFAFSENLLGLAPIAAPIIALTKSPLLAYNAAFILSYVLSGLGAYLLGFVLTRRHDAAFVAALAFAFAPYRLSHTHHLQLLSSYWMPAAVAALHLFVEDARPRWAVLFAAAWLMQALACGYYFFYLTLFALLWLAWFARQWLTLRDIAVLAGSWLAAALILAPLLLGYRAIQTSYGFKRSPVEIVNYSADVAGLWSAAPDSLLWRGLHGATVSSESEQFPGVAVVCLTVAAIAFARKRRDSRSPVAFYALSAVLMWALSLGPVPRLNGTGVGIPGPYTLLALLPGFDGMRVPARLWMVAVLCLSVCAAYGIDGISSTRARRWLVAVASLAILLDGWPRPLALFDVPPMRVTASRAGVRLGLPARENETETMYGAIAQARPVFNGYSGYAAPQHAALIDMLEAHDPRILDRLAATRPVEVLVEWATDPDGRWRGWLDGYGAVRVDVGDGWTSYEIAPTGFAAPPPLTGTRIKIASITASVNQHDIGAVLDDDLDSRWNAPRQQGNESITIDLGSAHYVRGVVMCLGAYPAQYPRALDAAVSSDGVSWQTAAAGNTVLSTYDAALQSPREVPVGVPIERDRVRFIRLGQKQTDSHGWSIVELRVIQ
jgi:F5/8 type C domain